MQKIKKTILIITALLLSIFCSAQYSPYTLFDFEAGSSQYVLTEDSKIKSDTAMSAGIIDSLSTGTKIKILSRTKYNTAVGEKSAPWYKVSYNNGDNTGYVWGGDIALGKYTRGDYLFLFGIDALIAPLNNNENQTEETVTGKIVALKNNKLIEDKNFPMGTSDNLETAYFKIIENKNLKNVELIMKASVAGAACGIPTYEQYFFWTDNHFYPLPRLTLVGDADAYARTEEYAFPKKPGNSIFMKIEEYEKDENNKEKTKTSTKKFVWDGKSLR